MYSITEVVLFFTLIGSSASKSKISTDVRMLPDVDYFRIECLTTFSEKRSGLVSLHLQRNTTGIIAQANFNVTWEDGKLACRSVHNYSTTLKLSVFYGNPDGTRSKASIDLVQGTYFLPQLSLRTSCVDISPLVRRGSFLRRNFQGGGYNVAANSSLNRSIVNKDPGNYSINIRVSRITPFGVSLALSFVIDRSRTNCDDKASYQCVSTDVYVNRSMDEEMSSKKIFITFQDIFKNAFMKRKLDGINSTRESTTNATTRTSKKDNKDRPALIAVACSAAVAILLVVGICVYFVNKKPKQRLNSFDCLGQSWVHDKCFVCGYADPKTSRKHGTLRQYSVFSNTTEAMSTSSQIQTDEVRPPGPATRTELIEVPDKHVHSLPNADGRQLTSQSSREESSTV